MHWKILGISSIFCVFIIQFVFFFLVYGVYKKYVWRMYKKVGASNYIQSIF